MENLKEQPVYEITKVKIKGDQLEVSYTERYKLANYQDNVTKASQQFVHPDLKDAFDMLKPHVAAICEFPEAQKVNVGSPTESDLEELKNFFITGYSKGGSDDSAGACIIAQKILKTGQTLNITTPFVKFEDDPDTGYLYGSELSAAISRCDYEVDAYLFEEKWGIKQESLDFDTPPESDITGGEPKKKGRSKKAKLQEVAEDVKEVQEVNSFDPLA